MDCSDVRSCEQAGFPSFVVTEVVILAVPLRTPGVEGVFGNGFHRRADVAGIDGLPNICEAARAKQAGAVVAAHELNLYCCGCCAIVVIRMPGAGRRNNSYLWLVGRLFVYGHVYLFCVLFECSLHEGLALLR